MRRRRSWIVATGLLGALAGASTFAQALKDEARFVHAPQHDGRYSNLAPFALPTLGDLADWYVHWLLQETAPSRRTAVTRTCRCCARTSTI